MESKDIKDTNEGKPYKKRILTQCCKAIRRIKKLFAEQIEVYKKQLEESGDYENVINQVCYLKNQDYEEVEAEGDQESDNKAVTDPSKHCTWTCQYVPEEFKFKIPRNLLKDAAGIVDKFFTKTVLDKMNHLENADDATLQAIDKLMKFTLDCDIRLSPSAHSKLISLYSTHIAEGKMANLKKVLDKKIPEEPKERKPDNKKSKQKSQAKQRLTEQDCDAFNFLRIYRTTKDAIGKKQKYEIAQDASALVEYFPILSSKQQKQIVQVVQVACKDYDFLGFLQQLDKKDYSYFCAALEHMISLYDSKDIEKTYKKMIKDLAFYEIKRVREEYITEWLEMEKTKEMTVLYEQVAQRIASILVDETLTFKSKGIANSEKQARTFWRVAIEDQPFKTAECLAETLDFIAQSKIFLLEKDVVYIRKVVIEQYLEPRITAEETRLRKEQASKEEAKAINEDSTKVEEDKEETIDTTHEVASKNIDPLSRPAIIEELEVKLSKIPFKNVASEKEEDTGSVEEVTQTKLDELSEDLTKFLQKPENLATLEQHISQIYTEQTLSIDDYKALAKVLNDIEQYLQQSDLIYEKYGTAKVENFGSSCNTLWSFNSDIDIVIEFEKDDSHFTKKKKQKTNKRMDLKKFNLVKCLCDIRNVLRPLAQGYEMEGIFTARVPILKFKAKDSKIDCDISINNTIGIANSKLVRLYCEIDQRVHIMVKYLRYLFKSANLLESDKGFLSSYSIIMMVIAFLQNQEDPILPSLFEKSDEIKPLTFYSVSTNKYKRVVVNPIESNFNENLHSIKKQFSTRNEKSVAQLVVEFFQHYFLSPYESARQIDITKGGFTDDEPDQRALFDIVEPLSNTSRVGQGCHKNSAHASSYKVFAYEFCKSVLESV